MLLQGVQPAHEQTLPVHALDRRCRHDGQPGAREAGLGDVCGMSLIEGLDHVDAIAQGGGEEHSETDGASGQVPFLGSNGDMPSQGRPRGGSRAVGADHSRDR